MLTTQELWQAALRDPMLAPQMQGVLPVIKTFPFVTGSEIEPVLGYAIDPRIEFDKYAPSALPTSNTCINKLTLPIGDNLPPDRSDIFDFFDYAFTSEYFGNI